MAEPSTSWDDMKRVREEEYFYRTERDKINALKEKRTAASAYLAETEQALQTFSRGFSAVRGGRLFKVNLGDDTLLDCPEEGTLVLSYTTLNSLLKAAKSTDNDTLDAWQRFLEVAQG